MDLFRNIEKALGKRDVIAEDLGFVTDSVRKLVHDSGFPGMKVVEFAFDVRDTGAASDYLPHNYIRNCVVYTGTHDNETLIGWWSSIDQRSRDMARDYMAAHYTPGLSDQCPIYHACYEKYCRSLYYTDAGLFGARQ